MDVVDPKRSALMGRIGGKDTKPELILRRALWAAGLRYRLGVKPLGVRADVVFPGPRVAVFVDGCFWHGCPDHYVRPRSRQDFWSKKLSSNVERDRRQTLTLEDAGWRVCRFWEHEIYERFEMVAKQVEQAVRGSAWAPDDSWRVVRVEPLDEAGDHERRTLEMLRSPEEQCVVEQARHTRKWKAR